MRITEEEARHAGELTQKHEGWTDKELALIIRTNKLMIAYLKGKGPEWHLALTPLFRELDTFKNFVSARKMQREKNA